MRILAIETASEACSVALFEGSDLIAHDHRVLGRGHAEQLVPMIAGLPDRGEAQKILVSLGPGSFTGVRIGIATARALGVAWQADVAGYPTLALIAAMTQLDHPEPVTVCVTGGHGEWFVQDFNADCEPETELASLAPEAATARKCHRVVAGSKAEEFSSISNIDYLVVGKNLPNASKTLLLPQNCFTPTLAPLYGRPPDAKPQSISADNPLKLRAKSA